MHLRLRRLLFAGLLSVSFTLTACGGGGGDADEGSTGLTGNWQAEANALLAANTANVGSTGVTCTGTMLLRFQSDGGLELSGDPVCSRGAVSGSGTIVTTARYSTSGNQLTISGAVTSGGVTIGGGTIPITFLGNGTATYSINGNTLSISFTNGSVGDVTQTWSRSGS
ncbi:hypothetical protein ACFOPI_02620 [Hydrogenophaga luteola]|uniref:Lipocalin-like domain-containing protein n=2 Tax=Hydrogenophaga luteola TaxID=1591122 RepID=A0ABV7VY55_9BURK